MEKAPEEEDIDPRLRNIDPKMIETIKHEVGRGCPV